MKSSGGAANACSFLYSMSVSFVSSIASALRAEKAPYVVTLFVAVLGWTALRTSDRLSNTPFVEYSVQNQSTGETSGGYLATVRLRNVTSAQTFDCFIVEQLTRGNFGEAVNQRVVYRGAVASNATVSVAQPRNWQWQVKDFMPGTDISLSAPMRAPADFKVLVRPCENAGAAANATEKEGGGKPKRATPIFLERSMVTWYVEHELAVLWGGLVAWLFFLIFLNGLRQPTPSPSPVRRIKRGTLKR